MKYQIYVCTVYIQVKEEEKISDTLPARDECCCYTFRKTMQVYEKHIQNNSDGSVSVHSIEPGHNKFVFSF